MMGRRLSLTLVVTLISYFKIQIPPPCLDKAENVNYTIVTNGLKTWRQVLDMKYVMISKFHHSEVCWLMELKYPSKKKEGTYCHPESGMVF
jgi:hypothetical protein